MQIPRFNPYLTPSKSLPTFASGLAVSSKTISQPVSDLLQPTPPATDGYFPGGYFSNQSIRAQINQFVDNPHSKKLYFNFPAPPFSILGQQWLPQLSQLLTVEKIIPAQDAALPSAFVLKKLSYRPLTEEPIQTAVRTKMTAQGLEQLSTGINTKTKTEEPYNTPSNVHWFSENATKWIQSILGRLKQFAETLKLPFLKITSNQSGWHIQLANRWALSPLAWRKNQNGEKVLPLSVLKLPDQKLITLHNEETLKTLPVSSLEGVKRDLQAAILNETALIEKTGPQREDMAPVLSLAKQPAKSPFKTVDFPSSSKPLFTKLSILPPNQNNPFQAVFTP